MAKGSRFYCLVLCCLLAGAQGVWAAPLNPEQRVVSLDHCTDRAITALLPEQRIAGVSPTAKSIYGPEALSSLPIVKLDVEAVLASGADAFVAQWGGGVKLHTALVRAGLTRLELPQAHAPEDLPSYIRNLGKSLGAQTAAEALAQETQIRLQHLQKAAKPQPQPTVLYLTAGGFSAGVDTYINALIELGGGQNLMGLQGRKGYFPLDLERVVGLTPDILLLGFFDAGLGETSHWGLARHKVLADRIARVPTITVSARALSCQDWVGLEVSERVAQAIAALISQEGKP